MRISTNQTYYRGLTAMQNNQSRLLKLQQQISTGKRIQFPSEDPIAAAKIEQLNNRIDSATRLQSNNDAAKGVLSFEESILEGGVHVMQRLRELQLQASNGSLSDDDRKAIATEMKSLQQQLVSIANTQDSEGSYIFSGARSNNPTVSVNASGQYVYGGDEAIRMQDITMGLRVAMNDSGSDIFMRLPDGNGRFSVTQSGNTGTVVASSGSVNQPSSYVQDDYTISFATNSGGETVVMVQGAASGNVLPPSGLADDAPVYESGNTISFNGIDIQLTGEPVVGDTFSIQPSQNQSIFSTIDRMIANLENPTNTAAQKSAVQTENNQMLEQIDTTLENFLNFQSDVGARMNQLDLSEGVNQNLIDTTKETLSRLEDVDMASVAVELQLQQIYLQASQQTFMRIQGLSAFNYL